MYSFFMTIKLGPILSRSVLVAYLAPARVMRAVAYERKAFDQWIAARKNGEPGLMLPVYVWEGKTHLSFNSREAATIC